MVRAVVTQATLWRSAIVRVWMHMDATRPSSSPALRKYGPRMMRMVRGAPTQTRTPPGHAKQQLCPDGPRASPRRRPLNATNNTSIAPCHKNRDRHAHLKPSLSTL
ncbi:hypothetical protein PLESTM_000970100 [Pleodorina starrii]|nr:hypothetical protein PLESTM_000970100 [Pleodorina starrii]